MKYWNDVPVYTASPRRVPIRINDALCLLFASVVVRWYLLHPLPGMGMWSIAISVSVCMYACLFVSQRTQSKCLKFSVRVTCDRGSVLLCYLLPFLWMTSCYHTIKRIGQNKRHIFRPVRQVAAPTGHERTLFGWYRQVAAPERSLRSPTASRWL